MEDIIELIEDTILQLTSTKAAYDRNPAAFRPKKGIFVSNSKLQTITNANRPNFSGQRVPSIPIPLKSV